jgi:hypothetical protein
MKPVIFAGAAAIMMHAVPASAASLCTCCGASTAENCAATCVPVKPPDGQCMAAVDFAGKSKITTDNNPLYGVSLRNVWLGTAKRPELETFRLLLEKARRGAERDRRAALRAATRKSIDQATAAARAKRYNDAIVNYFLGLQSYYDALRAM